MFKQLCTLGVLCTVASLSFAQSRLTIQIKDENQIPLKGATVTYGNIVQQTDQQGKVYFNQDSDTSKPIKINHIAYQSEIKTVKPEQNLLIINLSKKVIQAEEAFVYGTRAKKNSATTYKNLSKDEIEKNNLGQDIPYLLDQTPGVVIGSDAGAGIGYTSMRIRGSDNQRINVTLNGIPLNDAESMGSFFVNIPDFASSTESIQIQRGIGTSTNGAGAFGASINIQTDALDSIPYAELNNSFGSYNSWKNTIKVGSGLIQNKFAFNARLSRIASDGYIERASSNLQSFYVDGGLYTPKHTLKATVFSGKERTYQAWYGTPEPLIKGDPNLLDIYANEALGLYAGAEYERLMHADRRYNFYTYENQTDNYTQTHAHLQYSNILSPKWNLQIATHYTRGAGYYEEYRPEDKLSKYNIPSVEIGEETISKSDLVRRRWLDNHFYGLTYGLHYNPNTSWNFTWGGAYNEYIGDHYGEVIWSRYASTSELGDKYYLNDAKKQDFNTYLKADYKHQNWLVNLDVQYRYIHYRVKGDDDKIKSMDFDDTHHFINPKVGITYFVNPQSNFYASYAYAQKEPVRKDYVENPRNAFPLPEKMHNIEAGYRYNNQYFTIGTNLYAMLYKDQLIPTGTINDTGGALRMNIPNSYRIGWELDASWRISPQFVWSATAALSENKIKDFIEYLPIYNDDWEKVKEEQIAHGNTYIAMSPASILSNNFTYIPLKDFSISILSKYVSRMYLDNTSAKERSIDPYFVNNLHFNYSFTLWGIRKIDTHFVINNIFNTKYETSGYTWSQQFESKGQREFYNFYYPQATTNFMLGLNLKF